MNENSEQLTEILHVRVTATQRRRLAVLAEMLAARPTDTARVALALGVKALAAANEPQGTPQGVTT